MQPDLPWNIAGIPPDARETARASARREGLSVGEWLTRQIQRGLAEEPAQREPWQPAPRASQDTENMLASVSRSEAETQNAYKRMEDQLRAVARRLEAAERSQSENSRAMNKAATEINIATREQSQAFDQLGAHVVGLADRLSRIEQENAQDGLKDAVRGLHQGLSRLAEQIALTANQSADQIASLAGNVETVASKLIEARGDAESASRGLEERVGQIDDRIRAVERAAQASASTLERTLSGIEKNQSDMILIDGRMHAIEQTAQSSAGTLERALGGIEKHNGSVALIDERIRNLEQASDSTVNMLEQTIGSVEKVQKNTTLTDERIRNFEQTANSSSGRLEQALKSVEKSQNEVAMLAERLSTVEYVAGSSADTLDQALSTLNKHQKDVGTVDERLRTFERAAQTNASTLERALDSVEKSQNDNILVTGEIRRQASNLDKVGETLDRLSARFTSGEAQTSGAMARLEEDVARLESLADNDVIDRRLAGMEHTLSDIAGRLETNERSTAGNAGNVEETLRSLAQRVDAADKRHRESLAELRAAVRDANGRLTTVETTASASPAPLDPIAFEKPVFNLRPVPKTETFGQPSFESQQTSFDPSPVSESFAAAGADASAEHNHLSFGHARPAADTFAFAAEHGELPPGIDESYIAAARRSARDASAAAETVPTRSFWSLFNIAPATNAVADVGEKSEGTRYMLIGGIALIATVAIVTGIFLSQNIAGRNDASISADTSPVVFPRATSAAPDTSYTPPPPMDSVTSVPATSSSPSVATTNLPQTKSVVVKSAHVKPVPDTIVAATPPAISAPKSAAAVPPQVTQTPATRLAALAGGGNPRAEAALGFTYLDGTSGIAVNEAEGARWLERATRQGDAMAAYRLGTLYERGRGVPANEAKAIQLYQIAAKQGNRKAMHNLAVAYADGSGVPKNLRLAAQWFTKAAQLGLSDSQFNLAVLYERGMGVPQSLTNAYKWYAIAAVQGDSESKSRVDALATQLSPADKAAAQKAADSFQPQPLKRSANTASTPADVLNN